ncbi:TonB-dependent receptor [Chromatocurvus halotolerans]|uniref:Iron complex outermembrane receptor protein n=1 Tax=Chromatocurvus halotolerans TaxID=1132028 RepID=A0A4R2L4N7_9GAMM|nr:TonB-dependent receptor [Chromatocurvus halotolerans]TCO77578.1 iron complex outermembrane receptor protein [Chromatocurvus halotolerans]
MKKTLIAVCVGAASQAMAQIPESRMEHVLVTTPIHKKAAETALPVTVLSGDELRRLAASTLGETLGDKPGISNASFGPGVGRPVIRGQGGPRTINLNNAIAAADVSSLSPDHAVSIEPMLADSVEVLRGPATLLYGGGAIGGVINTRDNRIPSERIDGVQGAVEYRYDDAPEMNTGVLKFEGGSGDFAFHVSGTFRDFEDTSIPGLAIDEEAVETQEALLGGGHGGDHEEDHDHEEEEFENSDGFIANTDGDADVFTIGGSYHFGERDFVGFSYNSFETNYGIPPGAHEHGHEEEHDHDGEHDHEGEEHGEEEDEIIRIDLKQERYDTQLHIHDLVPGLIDVARGFLTYTDYEHVELEGVEIGTQFSRQTYEGRLELVREGDNHGVLGLQWRADEFEAVGDEAYVPKTDSSEWGVFYVQDFHAADWQFEVGGRADIVDRDPATGAAEDFTSFSLSASGLYNISREWNLGVSLSRAERAPSTEELFSNLNNTDEQLVTHAATGVIEIGDPDIGTETSLNGDLSLTWTAERSFAELTVFYNTFSDYIFLLNTGEEVDETPVYIYEQEDAKFYGVEFESSFALARVAGGDVSLGVFGDMITGEFDSAGDVPRLPPMRIGSELSWRSDSLGAYVRFLNASDQDDPGDFETGTDGYTRWDAGVDYRVQFAGNNELLAFLKLKNITDEEIRLSTSFLRNFAPQAGESIEAGVRFMF